VATAVAGNAIASIRDAIGTDAVVGVQGGHAAELEERSDELIAEAGRLRVQAEEKFKTLREITAALHDKGGL
jgi:hypothetical protein